MLLIDQYAYINKLHKVHPAEKMALSLLLLFFSLLVRDKLVSCIIFILMSVLIIGVAKIPWRYYVKLLLLPSFFLLSSLVTIVISFTKTDVPLPAHYFSLHTGQWVIFVSHTGVMTSIELFVVVMGSLSCLYFLILTTSIQSICHVLKKLRIPPLFVELVELTYRFIFIFMNSSKQIYIAQQSRLGYQTFSQSLRSVAQLVTSLFVEVFQRAKEVTNALQSRTISVNPLYWEDDIPFSFRNWIVIGSVFSTIVLFYITKKVYG